MAVTTTILDVRSAFERVLKAIRKGAVLQGYEYSDTEVAVKVVPPSYDVVTFNGVTGVTLLPAKKGVRYHIFGIDLNAHNDANTECYRLSCRVWLKGKQEHIGILYMNPNAVYSGSKYTPCGLLTDENTEVDINFDGVPEGARGFVYYKEVMVNAL